MSAAVRVLVVDDDEDFATVMVSWLEAQGYEAERAHTVEAALRALQDGEFAVAFLDLWMREGDGLDLLNRMRERGVPTETVMLTGSATVDTAVQALKLGALDYVTKPVEPLRLAGILRKAVDRWRQARQSRAEAAIVRLEPDPVETARSSFHAMVGDSPAMRTVFHRIEVASHTRTTVLIRGESGTGKELVARALHAHTGQNTPFVPVNCAALPRDLIEAELFGHTRGAFTSAEAESKGLFVSAAGGTLFLDEITEMSPETQAKLLRAIQEKRIRPVGSPTEVAVDVRVIASTNRDPREAVSSGKLREDLFYRLSVATIHLPPLRERAEDVPLLVRHFLAKCSERHARPAKTIERGAMLALQRYAWPGNVRELENVVEQAYLFGAGATVVVADLPSEVHAAATATKRTAALEGVVSLKEAERIVIQQTLAKVGGNKTRAAQALGISRKHLYTRMKSLGLGDADSGNS